MCNRDDWLEACSIIRGGLASIGPSVYCIDGGNRLAAGMEVGNIVLHDSLYCWTKVEGRGELRVIGKLRPGVLHELSPVIFCDGAIPHPMKYCAEEHLNVFLSRLVHDLVQHNSFVEELVC